MDKKLTEYRTVSKLYVCGPMSGLPDHNLGAFQKATCRLRKLGFSVVDPSELDAEKDSSVESLNAIKSGDRRWAKLLGRDLPFVIESDALVALPGWEDKIGRAHV